MSEVSVALSVGGLLGASVWVLWVALRPPRTDLVAASARWDQQRQRYPATAKHGTGDPATGRDGTGDRGTGRGALREIGASGRLGEWLTRQAASRGWQLTGLRADLVLLERSLESHLVTKVLMGAAGLLLPACVSAVLLLGGVGVPWVGSALVGLVLAAVFFVVPDISVAKLAADRRSDLRRALGSYLDLVSMSLAGGRGVPEALPTAASIATGWAFELLAHTVATARSSGITAWTALGELGERTGSPELRDLGSALSLVANDGAKVRESLSARASSLRRRQLSEAEGEAKRASQSMTAAQILLAVGFLVFLGYPALVNVLAI